MSLLAILPMHSHSRTTPLRQPIHRSPRQKLPSPNFTDRWRDRMRSDLVARVKSAREQSATDARGGEEEIMRVIFRGEEKRRLQTMEKEASLIHSEALNHIDESEEIEAQINPDEALLEELFRKEEEEVLALLAALEETEKEDTEMQDVLMTDIDFKDAP